MIENSQNMDSSETEDRTLLLDLLNKEYESLLFKLNQTRKLIINNGGKDPGSLIAFQLNIPDYPYSKTLKEKIIFLLKKQENQKLTAKEIHSSIRLYEPETPLSSVSQFCSMLGKTGEIEVIEGYRNRYFIPAKKKVQELHRSKIKNE